DGIDASCVGDDLGATVEHEGQGGPQVQREIARVAQRLVSLAVLLEDGEGQLGESLTHQVVDPGVEHVGHLADAIAVEALAAPDAYRHAGEPSGLRLTRPPSGCRSGRCPRTPGRWPGGASARSAPGRSAGGAGPPARWRPSPPPR